MLGAAGCNFPSSKTKYVHIKHFFLKKSQLKGIGLRESWPWRRVSTEVDARHSFDVEQSLRMARRFIAANRAAYLPARPWKGPNGSTVRRIGWGARSVGFIKRNSTSCGDGIQAKPSCVASRRPEWGSISEVHRNESPWARMPPGPVNYQCARDW